MGKNSAFRNSHFTFGDTLKHRHALLEELKAFNINEIGAWQTVLGNKNRLLVPF